MQQLLVVVEDAPRPRERASPGVWGGGLVLLVCDVGNTTVISLPWPSGALIITVRNRLEHDDGTPSNPLQPIDFRIIPWT